MRVWHATPSYVNLLKMEQIEKSLLLLISNTCNLNCKYCYEWHKDNRKMTWEQVHRILENEFLNNLEPIESIDILGGEPLTNYELIPLISDWVWRHSPETKLFARTNGVLLDEGKKAWFRENKERFILGLSMDGIPEVNFINRGVKHIDYDFFVENWPDNPIKMTIFPDSVHLLADSVITLYEKGYKLIGGLAQGVLWNKEHCLILNEQLSILVDYYVTHLSVTPLEPVFDLNFEKAFWVPTDDALEMPCWEKARIHSYDCDGELLPCHMFSKIVQGEEKRSKILEDAKTVRNEIVVQECLECPIRWCCKTCMAMNYQHTGDFGKNINIELMCEAQKVAAAASAKLILFRNADKDISSCSLQEYEKINNALRFLKQRKEI